MSAHNGVLHLRGQIDRAYQESNQILVRAATTYRITRIFSPISSQKKELEAKISQILAEIRILEPSDHVSLSKKSATNETDLEKLIFAIEVINPNLRDQLLAIETTKEVIENLKYRDSDTAKTIKEKGQAIEKLGLMDAPDFQEEIKELVIKYIELFPIENVDELKLIMDKSPQIIRWIWNEIKDIPNTDDNSVKDAIQFGYQHSGFIEMMGKTCSQHISRLELLRQETNFVGLHSDQKMTIEAPKILLNEVFNPDIVGDLHRTNSSLNFQKIQTVSIHPEENRGQIKKITKEVGKTNFNKMSHVAHQGLNAAAQTKLREQYDKDEIPILRDSVDGSFGVHYFIFKNDIGETIYRYVNVLAVSTTLDPTGEYPVLNKFHVHIVDCKADSSESCTIVSRYVSEGFDSPEDAKNHFVGLLN